MGGAGFRRRWTAATPLTCEAVHPRNVLPCRIQEATEFFVRECKKRRVIAVGELARGDVFLNFSYCGLE